MATLPPIDPRRPAEDAFKSKLDTSVANHLTKKVDENRSMLRELNESLPSLIRTQTDSKIKDSMQQMLFEIDGLKSDAVSMGKDVVGLMKWKAQGQVTCRDDLVAAIWISAFLGLSESGRYDSFERLVATAHWCGEAFSSAQRQLNVKKFAREYLNKYLSIFIKFFSTSGSECSKYG